MLQKYMDRNPTDTEFKHNFWRARCWKKESENNCTAEEAQIYVTNMQEVCFSNNGDIHDLIMLIKMQNRTNQANQAIQMVKDFARMKKSNYEQLSTLANLSLGLNDPHTALSLLHSSLTQKDCPVQIKDQYNTIARDTGIHLYQETMSTLNQVNTVYQLGGALGKVVVRSAFGLIKPFFKPPPPPDTKPPTPS